MEKIMTPVGTGFVLWLLGPTSAGKTTLARALLPALQAGTRPVMHYDGDEFRDLFGSSHGFSAKDRGRVVEALVHMAAKAAHAGCCVVVSALTANESARELVKTACPNVILGYVRCSLEECMERDPKGLYARAKSGEIDTLIGYNSAYPEPDAPDLILDTAGRDVQVVLEEVLSYLAFQGWLTKDH